MSDKELRGMVVFGLRLTSEFFNLTVIYRWFFSLSGAPLLQNKEGRFPGKRMGKEHHSLPPPCKRCISSGKSTFSSCRLAPT